MIRYYEAFRQFLDSAAEEVNRRRSERAQQKLLRLSPTQFYELATDIYDEVQRRQNNAQGDQEFLSPNESLHPKRNQARKKLSLLSHTRFSDLTFDILFEIERRTPSVHRILRDGPRDENINQLPPLLNGSVKVNDNSDALPQYMGPPPSRSPTGPPQYPQHLQGNTVPPNGHANGTPNGFPNRPPNGPPNVPPNYSVTPPSGPPRMNRPPENPNLTKNLNDNLANGNHTSSSTNSTYYSDIQSGSGHEGSALSSPRSPSQFSQGYDPSGKSDSRGSGSGSGSGNYEMKRQPPPPLTIPPMNSGLYSDNRSPLSVPQSNGIYADDGSLKSPGNAHLQTSMVTPTKSTLVEETDDDGSEVTDDDSSFHRHPHNNNETDLSPRNNGVDPRQANFDHGINANNGTTNTSSHLRHSNGDSIDLTETISINDPTGSNNNTHISLEPLFINQASSGIEPPSMGYPRDGHQAALDDKDEQIQLLVEEGTRMDENITKLETQLTESEALKETLVEENGRLHQMIGEVEVAKDTALNELEMAKQEFGAQTERYINDLETKQRNIANMEIQHQQLKEKHAEVISSQAGFATDSSNLNNQIMILEGKLLKQESVCIIFFLSLTLLLANILDHSCTTGRAETGEGS